MRKSGKASYPTPQKRWKRSSGSMHCRSGAIGKHKTIASKSARRRLLARTGSLVRTPSIYWLRRELMRLLRIRFGQSSCFTGVSAAERHGKSIADLSSMSDAAGYAIPANCSTAPSLVAFPATGNQTRRSTKHCVLLVSMRNRRGRYCLSSSCIG